MNYFIETFVYIMSILGIMLATYFLTIKPYYLNRKCRFIKKANSKKSINIFFRNIDNEKLDNIINKDFCKDMNININIYKIIDKK